MTHYTDAERGPPGTYPEDKPEERFECWTCDGAGEKDRPNGATTTCTTCDGAGDVSEETLRQMWHEFKYAEDADDELRADGGKPADGLYHRPQQVNLRGNRVQAFDFLGLPVYREGISLADFGQDAGDRDE